jgi:excisionase family DNA binding protein
MEKILTVNDVADVLQVKAITVREMFREKRLRGFKVGKAWRTTEVMLQEDISALARGEAPAELPSLDGAQEKAANATGKSGKKPPPPPAVPQRPAVAESLSPTPEAAKSAPPRPNPPKSPAKQPPSSGSEDDEDTQQMLF